MNGKPEQIILNLVLDASIGLTTRGLGIVKMSEKPQKDETAEEKTNYDKRISKRG